MMYLILRSWLYLLYFEMILQVRGLPRIHQVVLNQKTRSHSEASSPAVRTLCHAIDVACVFYFKEVLCLQRSAATTVLLRQFGWDAEMVIGAQVRPFKSHAWVEVGKLVVSDKPYVPEIYRELERC
jgi:hypothetical protein